MPYTDRDALLFGMYNSAMTLAILVGALSLPLLMLMGERFRAGLGQRVGLYPRAIRERLRGTRPIWIHAASVGEVLSTEPLVRELRRRFPQLKLVVSTFTYTGQRLGRSILPVDAVIFLPIDLSWIVRRTLGTFNPLMLVLVETEIWPNLLRAACRRAVPVLLVSGRISPRSLQHYKRCGFFFRRVMRSFTALGMQTAADAHRIAQLGAEPGKITVTGSLKLSVPTTSAERPGAATAPEKTPGDLLWVVGSSHRGEEEIALDSFSALKRRFPNLRMVLAPRHPERFDEVERLLVERGLDFERRSHSRAGVLRRDILLLDTIGELLQFYAVGDIAFVGGSLVQAGGHNVLEPARYQVPVIFGPHMENFKAITEEMKQSGGGIEVCGSEDLIHQVTNLLADGARRREMGIRAYELATAGRDVLERTLELVIGHLQFADTPKNQA